ncbi:MAG: hypothetical protein AB8B58_10470 [Roseobacter sp.]
MGFTKTFKALATAACLSLTTATAGFAVPINVTFSFTDADGFFCYTSAVTGVIEGLGSDGLGQKATCITAKGRHLDYVFTSFRSSTHDVSAGFIDTGSVQVSAISTNRATSGGLGILDLSGANARFSLLESETLFLFGFPSELIASEITFPSDGTPATVPLPAGGWLLLSGMVGVPPSSAARNATQSTMPQRPHWTHMFQRAKYCA